MSTELIEQARKILWTGLKELDPMLQPADIKITVSEPETREFILKDKAMAFALAMEIGELQRDIRPDFVNHVVIEITSNAFADGDVIRGIRQALANVTQRHITYGDEPAFGVNGSIQDLAAIKPHEFVREIKKLPPPIQSLSA